DRTERLEGEVAEDHLEREQGAADRGVVGGGDAGGGPPPAQDVETSVPRAGRASDQGSDGGTHRDERPLAAERAAGGNRADGRERLDQAAAEWNVAAALRHRL